MNFKSNNLITLSMGGRQKTTLFMTKELKKEKKAPQTTQQTSSK
jgi:hypothetical protein